MIEFNPFKEQEQFLLSPARIRGAFAGKRGGKTEVGAIEVIRHAETRPGYDPSSLDPYLILVIAPTFDMLRRVSMQKIRQYAAPFAPNVNESRQEIIWHNGSIIRGISGDKPARAEGQKVHVVWEDEVFQLSEQMFLEAIARVADTRGKIWCTGSLGVQYENPRLHWAHKHFKEKPSRDTECIEWPTIANPYFPREEIERLRETLDERTFQMMFEINWDIAALNMVYEDLSEENYVYKYQYNPRLPIYICVDWGWTHELALGYFQHDAYRDRVYLFDEIVVSKTTLDTLYSKMQERPYRITEYICDIAGSQEREQTGISNIQWFRNKSDGRISFKSRTSAIQHGVSVVRSFIKNSQGQRRFFIDPDKCPKSLAGLRAYSYPVKNGMVYGELPEKKDDDCADMIRYYFVYKHDYSKPSTSIATFDRWEL